MLERCRRHGIPRIPREISLAEARRADGLLCTGTIGEPLSVTRLDGRSLLGPLNARLSEQPGEMVREEAERSSASTGPYLLNLRRPDPVDVRRRRSDHQPQPALIC